MCVFHAFISSHSFSFLPEPPSRCEQTRKAPLWPHRAIWSHLDEGICYLCGSHNSHLTQDTLSLTQFHPFFRLDKYLRPIIYPESILSGWVSYGRHEKCYLRNFEPYWFFCWRKSLPLEGTELESPTCPTVWMASSIFCEKFSLVKNDYDTLLIMASQPLSRKRIRKATMKTQRKFKSRQKIAPENISADERKKQTKKRWKTLKRDEQQQQKSFW